MDSACLKRFDIEQVVARESTTYLRTGTAKLNQRFARGESEEVGRLFGTQLMRARDGCGGRSPEGAKGLTITSDDPPGEIWSVRGAAGRVWMRWTAESLSWVLRCRNPGWQSRLPAASSDLQSAALTFTPTPGNARVYVYRPASSLGWATIRQVLVDSQPAGDIDTGTFVMVEVRPGRRRVEAASGGVITFDAAPDSVYFIKASWKGLTIKERTTMRLMPGVEGRAAVAESQLVRSPGAGTEGRADP